MKGVGLRARLTILNAFVLALAVLGCGAASDYVVRSELLGQIDNHLLDQAHVEEKITLFLQDSNSTATRDFASQLQSLLKRIDSAQPGGSSATRFHSRLFDLRGQPVENPLVQKNGDDAPLDKGAFEEASRGIAAFRNVKIDGAPRRVLANPIRSHGQIILIAQVTAPLDSYLSTVRRMGKALVRLIPLAFGISIVGGAFLTGRGLRPIKRIVASAEQIHAGSLDLRLPVEGNDEVSRMAVVFNDMLTRLQSAFDQQQRFLADASHELRTPLSVLKANTSLALLSKPDLIEYEKALRNADSAANRMSSLVDDLLVLSRFDAGEELVRLEPTDVCKAIDSAMLLLVSSASQEGVNLKFVRNDGLIAKADREYLERILINLISNAIRHTPPDGRVVVTAAESDGYATIEVSDNGSGIAEEHLPHIFKRFYRVDSSRSRREGGSGLGLSICKTLAKAMKGTITVVSQVGEGTIFTLTLETASLDRPESLF